MMRKYAWILLILIAKGSAVSFSQNKASDTSRVYKSLEKALQTPELVYHIDLSSQKLKSFPEEILSLNNLKTLNLSKNKIKEIPALATLKRLEEINLSKNKLSHFPEGIIGCKNLRLIDIGGNDITDISEDIKKLVELTDFIAWGNAFKEIPEFFKEMDQIQTVDLRAMLFSYEEQRLIYSYFPKATVLFDEGCDCD